LFNGSTLLSVADHHLLNEWYGIKNAKWKCVYKGSKDGFKSSTFHEKCDSATESISVISANGALFGGYTNASWAGSANNKTNYVSSSNSWLFSLKKSGSVPMKITNHVKMYSIAACPQFMCTFGGGHDLHIADDCNKTTSSYANLGHSYYVAGVAHKSKEAQELLAGAAHFKVDDIEVFVRE